MIIIRVFLADWRSGETTNELKSLNIGFWWERERKTRVLREKSREAEWRTKHSVESEIQPSLHRWKASALFSLKLTKLLFYRSLGSTSPAQHPLSCSLRHLTITASTEELLMESCWLLCSWENGWSSSAMRSTCLIWIIMVRKDEASSSRLVILGNCSKWPICSSNHTLTSVTRHTIVSLATIVRPGYQTRILCDDTCRYESFRKDRRFEFF